MGAQVARRACAERTDFMPDSYEKQAKSTFHSASARRSLYETASALSAAPFQEKVSAGSWKKVSKERISLEIRIAKAPDIPSGAFLSFVGRRLF